MTTATKRRRPALRTRNRARDVLLVLAVLVPIVVLLAVGYFHDRAAQRELTIEANERLERLNQEAEQQLSPEWRETLRQAQEDSARWAEDRARR